MLLLSLRLMTTGGAEPGSDAGLCVDTGRTDMPRMSTSGKTAASFPSKPASIYFQAHFGARGHPQNQTQLKLL